MKTNTTTITKKSNRVLLLVGAAMVALAFLLVLSVENAPAAQNRGGSAEATAPSSAQVNCPNPQGAAFVDADGNGVCDNRPAGENGQPGNGNGNGNGVCDGTGNGSGYGNGVCDGTGNGSGNGNGVCDGTGNGSGNGNAAAAGNGVCGGTGNGAAAGNGVCDGTGGGHHGGRA